MAEPRADPPPNSASGKNVKAPNVFERVKEEFEAVLHNEKHKKHHHKETHGLRDDIDVNTSMSDVKAPNVFERAKEEIEALVGAIHPNKTHDLQSNAEKRDAAARDGLKSEVHSDKNVKTSNPIEKGKEALRHAPHRHNKETHGTSEDFDANTPISEVKGPNVFERAKEEIEALVQTIHPKKDSDKNVKTSNPIEKGKEALRHAPQHHHKETHGKSDDFDANTPISDVKGPNVFERAKEEIEALVQTIHSKKDSGKSSQ